MDPLTLTVLASIASILAFIYIVLFGQRSIADLATKWWERRRGKGEEKDLTQIGLKLLREKYPEADRGLKELQAQPSGKLSPDALLRLGEAEAYSGELDKARQHSNESLSLLEELRDADKLSDDEAGKIGIAYNNIGFVFRLHGEWDKALLCYDKSLEFGRTEREKANVLNNKGNVYRLKGEFDAALSHCKHSLAMRRKMDIPYDLGLSLNTLGMIYRDMGYIRHALKFFREALETLREAESLRGRGLVYINLGDVRRSVEDYEKALHFLREAREIFERLSDRVSLAETLNKLGCLHRDQQKYQQAEDTLSSSLELARHDRDWFRMASTLEDLSVTFYQSGDLVKAEGKAREAKDLAQNHDYIALQSKFLRTLGDIAFAKGLFREAFDGYAEACWVAAKYSFPLYWRVTDLIESQLWNLPGPERDEVCRSLIGFWHEKGVAGKYPELVEKCKFALSEA